MATYESFFRRALLGAVVASAALLCLPGGAQSTVSSASEAGPASLEGPLPARLSDVEGSVRVAAAAPAEPASATPGGVPPPPPDAVFDPAQINMPLLPGSALETGDDGRAEVQFNDGSVARVTPASGLGVITATSEGEEARALSGLTYYEVPGSSIGQLTMLVGRFLLTPSLNSLVRVDMDTKPYRIAALRGTVQLDDAGAGVVFTLDQGQAAAIDPADPAGYSVSQEIASNSWDQWNTDRDDALAEMAQGETSARDNSADADADAWNDLDYYGTWYDVPDAGEAWAPDGVDADFDPYGNGSWAYYNDLGYLWISGYPWGWLPYHCGNWNFFPGFGWMWQPVGGCGLRGGRGWYPWTGISHAPAGYRLPQYGGTVNRRLHGRITGVPIGPIHPVDRGLRYRFRAVGGTRPEPRQLALRGTGPSGGSPGFANTLPVFAIPQQYRGGGTAAGGARAAYVPAPGLHGSALSPTPRTYTPPPRVISPTPHTYTPAPRTYEPPPRMESPAVHAEAPHAAEAPSHSH